MSLEEKRKRARERSRKRRTTPEYKEYMQKTRESRLKQYKLYRQENKEHLKQLDRDNYYKNRERNLKNKKEYREKNKDAVKAREKEWATKNPEKIKAKNKRYYKENYGKVLKSVYKREFALKNAKIYKHLETEIEEVYNLCPTDKVVDHIVPLQGKNVCGLHVPWNMQYLDSKSNNFKRNKFDGTYDNNSWKNVK